MKKPLFFLFIPSRRRSHLAFRRERLRAARRVFARRSGGRLRRALPRPLESALARLGRPPSRTENGRVRGQQFRDRRLLRRARNPRREVRRYPERRRNARADFRRRRRTRRR